MTYKQLFKRLKLILASPVKAWDEIQAEPDKSVVGTAFVFPLLMFCGVTAFVGRMSWDYDALMLQSTIKAVCTTVVALFASYFAVAYVVDQLSIRWLHRESEMARCRQFVGYGMAVVLVLQFFLPIIPGFTLFYLIAQFYTVYILWVGAQRLMAVEEDHLLLYTIVTSALVLFTPWVIQILLEKLFGI